MEDGDMNTAAMGPGLGRMELLAYRGAWCWYWDNDHRVLVTVRDGRIIGRDPHSYDTARDAAQRYATA